MPNDQTIDFPGKQRTEHYSAHNKKGQRKDENSSIL